MTKRLLMGLLLGLSIASLAHAGVVAIEESGGAWTSQEVLAGDYSSVCFNAFPNQFMAAGPNGAKAIYKQDTWKTIHASDTAYNDIVCNSKAYDEFIAPRTAGGVDYVPWSSSQDTGVAGTFTKVVKNHTVTAPNCYFGLDAAGGVNEIYHSAGGEWRTNATTGVTGYTQIASNNYENQVLALNSGGVDLIYYDQSAWNAIHTTDGTYSLLVGDDQVIDSAYLAGPNGLTYIYDDHGYKSMPINSTLYTSLAPIGGDTLGVFGALASGGIEKIYFDGANIITETVLTSGNFSRLANDYSSPSVLLGIEVPEPATMILLAIGGLLLRKRS